MRYIHILEVSSNSVNPQGGTLVNVPSTPIQESLIGFGKRLREARRRLNLSGVVLASKLGLDRSAIAHYEAGRTFPSVSALKNLTRILGVSLDWLVFDEYEEAGQIQDKELASYIVKADRLHHQQRSLVKGFIDSLLASVELEELKRASSKPKRAA